MRDLLRWMLPIGGTLIMAACAPSPGTDSRPKTVEEVQIGQPGKARCSATSQADAAAFVAATNRQRAAHGLTPITVNAKLNMAASGHACDMAAQARMTHVGANGSGPAARVKALGYHPALTAENIAAGYRVREQVFERWYANPGHRRNLLIPSISEAGFGHAVAADGKTRFWTAVYSRPR